MEIRDIILNNECTHIGAILEKELPRNTKVSFRTI